MKPKHKVTIIGFGRFGELLANLGKDYFDIHIAESDPARKTVAEQSGFKLINFEDVATTEFIFLAVPISQIENTVIKLEDFVDERHTIIDLCSVKVYPAQLMQKHLTKSSLLATHPMFGPDSAKNGLEGLRVAFCPLKIEPPQVNVVKDFWESVGATVSATTPEDHDKDSVYSQAFTYSLAQIILNMQLPDVTYTTRSFDNITNVAKLSANDSDQLFHDMLFYNPYFADMKKQLQSAIDKTMHRLEEIEDEQVKAWPFEQG